MQTIARLERKARRLVAMAGARAHPAFLADHHGDRLVHHLDLQYGFLFGLNQGAARVGKGLGVRLDLLDHQAAQRRRVAQNLFQLALLGAQFGQLLLDLDRLQPCQLTQADFEDVFSLPIRQFESLNQGRLGIVRLADDGDHFIDIEQNRLAAFEDMDAVQHLGQTVLRSSLDSDLAKGNPLLQHLAERLLCGPTIQPNHGQIDG